MPGALDYQARIGPFDTTMDERFVAGYAEATKDPNPRYRAGSAVPPVAVATRIFAAQLAGMEKLLPSEVMASAAGGVHGEHDVVLHRPPRVGEPLRTFVEAHSARPAGSNLRIVFRHLTLDAADRPVAEQLWTTLLIGAACEPGGPEPPGHTFPEEARRTPAGGQTVSVDEAMTSRYAELSGDFSAHHFDVEAARRSGFDRVFLHGLCTMGLTCRAAVDEIAGGDPRLVRRVAVRFASPMFLGDDLVTDLYAAGPDRVAFEAHCAGTRVIGNGLVELRPALTASPA